VPNPSPPDSVRPARKKRARLWLFAGAGALAALIAGGALLYAFRGPIGVALAVHYLEGKGIPAAIEIERLDFKGFVGKARLGPEQDPDLTVERIEVAFEPIPILKSGLAAPRIASLKLTQPRLKGRWDGKRLYLGTLQPLLDEMAKQPPAAGPGPKVTIERGEARIATPYGALVAEGDGALDKGRIVRAQGRLLPARLSFDGNRVALGGASLSLDGNDARLTGRLVAQLSSLEGGFRAGPSRLNLGFALPYGADGLARFDGPMSADLAAELGAPEAGAAKARALKLDARLQGRLSGPVETLAANLSGQLRLNGEALSLPGVAAIPVLAADAGVQGLSVSRSRGGWRLAAARIEAKTAFDRLAAGALTATAPKLDLVLEQAEAGLEGKAWSIGAPLNATVFANRVAGGGLGLPGVAVKAAGRVQLASGTAVRIDLSGSASSGPGGMNAKDAAAWGMSLASLGDETRIAQALRNARLSVPSWSLAVADGESRFRIGAPARLGAASLSRAQVAFKDGRGSGAASLAVAGEGLPSFSAAAASFTFGPDGAVAAPLQLKLAFSGPLLHGVETGGAARLSGRPGALTLALPACLPLAIAAMGEETPPLAADAKLQLCPEGGPALTLSSSGWRARLALRNAQARLPVSEATASGGTGLLTLAGQGAPETGRLELQTVRLTDAAAETRFRPITAAGALDLRDGVWAGDVRIREAALGRALALVHVRQAMGAAEGSAEIDATSLNFQPGALQPIDLSPIAEMISEVKAETRFTGKIAWKDGAVTSSGRFDTEGAAFKSQFGQVTGAVAHIDFDSLLPVTAPAGQVFTADQVDWIVPLTRVAARFGLTETSTRLQSAAAVLAKGQASLGPLEIPFEEGGRMQGKAELKGVDLSELVTDFNLSDSVMMQGKIDASVPFDIGPQGFRIADGFAVSTGPGRLSIQRSALTGAVATGGAAGAPPNAVQDFAYQALENLAFDSLEAKIASRPEGRLGIIFHIKGRNDPPVAKNAVISLFDLIRGKAFDKPIPLPKGTPVDLTLDTSLNFDELLQAYTEAARGGSAAVQPK
jgi:hypothetical protein